MNLPNSQRRLFLKGALASGVVGALVGAGLLTPQQALAWPKEAFESETLEGAMKALFEDAEITESDQITLKAPDIAENGAVVPISVQTDLPNVEMISIIAVNNPSPLAASFQLTPETVADVSTRIKMGETSDVLAVVKADGKLYSTRKEVKVTIGGCGG